MAQHHRLKALIDLFLAQQRGGAPARGEGHPSGGKRAHRKRNKAKRKQARQSRRGNR